jgi:polysaccharide deacetylase family protein (PEP-CTERM system associated)
MRNLLTIDVEEYFQVEGFADVVDRGAWGSYESRVAAQTRRLLDLLDETRQKATFFVLAWSAARHPDVVREIVRRGHEVASHGTSHRMVDVQGPDDFRRDVRDARSLLESLAGAPVTGYRAPSFSITERTPWAHRILAEEGYVYSSSVFPVRHDRYGIPDAPRTPWVVRPGDGLSIVEVPPLTLRVLGQNLPVAGGGYMRLLPVGIISKAIERMNADGHPAVIYLHPWEIDPDQPRIPGRATNRFRHYVGLASMFGKLRTLLNRHAFGTMGAHLGAPSQRSAPAAPAAASPPSPAPAAA